jgi:ABC-2 type transport system ATP-binding protein
MLVEEWLTQASLADMVPAVPADAPAVEEPATAPAVILRATDIRKSFGSRVAVSDVSVEVRRGEALAIIGPNGAGKTTLLEILAGAQKADSGTVERPKGGVGWVPQRMAIYTRLTVLENLRLFAQLEKVPEPADAVRRMLALTGLEERQKDPVNTLSGGNRQRVNVAVGLLADPPVLLLDEPSAALDPRQRARFWAVIDRLLEARRAVVFTTHDVAEAARHSTRLLVLADGEELFAGPKDDLVQQSGTAPGADLETSVVSFLRAHGH